MGKREGCDKREIGGGRGGGENLKTKHRKHHNKMLITTNIEIKMQFIYNCT